MKYLFVLIPALFLMLFLACQPEVQYLGTTQDELKPEILDYFEEDIPFSTTRFDRNPFHDNIASIGRMLFYDTRLSKNNSISCASCHQQRKGFADNLQFSVGLKNQLTTRNSMALVNNAYQPSHFWEGNPGTIEDHILNPVSNHIEMGMRSKKELFDKLSEIEGYRYWFHTTFGQEINEEVVQSALAYFVASMISYNSKFDKGRLNDFADFTPSELEGKKLFFGDAGCAICHRDFGPGQVTSGPYYPLTLNANIGLDLVYEDQGAGNGNFKAPTLRNIGLTAPYMHDGRFETLEEVVNHYTDGIKNHPNLSGPLQAGITLNETEKKQLVKFLYTLTDYEFINDPRFSDPFK